MIIPNKPIADFLNKVIIDTNLIFINLWSVVHLLAGFFIMKYFLYGKSPPLSNYFGNYNPMIYLFGLLVIYEIFELIVIKSGSSFFRAENMRDIAWDLIIGVIGGFIYLKFFI